MLTCIDLFAGLGGSSQGAVQAGLNVLWAADWEAEACAVYALNHPGVELVCQDLTKQDWSVVPRVDVLLASPECQGYSLANTLTQQDPERLRCQDTAWVVLEAARALQPRVIIVENVARMLRWASLAEWVQEFEKLGYVCSMQVLNAADHGTPQARKRLFVVLNKSKLITLALKPQRRMPASSCYLKELSTDWLPVSQLPDWTRLRVERGMVKYGLPFVSHYVTDDSGHSLLKPLPTITTKHQYAWVVSRNGEPSRRMSSAREYARAMGLPDSYIIPQQPKPAVRLLGNAVPPNLMCAVLLSVTNQL